MRLLLLFLGMLAPACGMARPPIVLDTEHGRVRAHDEASARLVAAPLSMAPVVRELLESKRRRKPEVWLLDFHYDDDWIAANNYDRIELGPRAMEALDYYIAHELVHWYVIESPFEGLPELIEEGLADQLALQLTNRLHQRRLETMESPSVEFSAEILYARGPVLDRFPREEAEVAARMASMAVERLGLLHLRALAARRANSVEIFEAAGLRHSTVGHEP